MPIRRRKIKPRRSWEDRRKMQVTTRWVAQKLAPFDLGSYPTEYRRLVTRKKGGVKWGTRKDIDILRAGPEGAYPEEPTPKDRRSGKDRRKQG